MERKFNYNDRLIASAASTCLKLFDCCLDREQEPATTQADSGKDLQSQLDSQCGRFRIWAENIGVFASNHASLDYRLWHSAQVKDLIVSQLSNLQRHLERVQQECFSLAEHSERGTVPHIAAIIDNTSESQSSASSRSGDDLTDLVGGCHEMRMIIDIITRLYRLSMAIRRSAPVDRHLKVAEHVERDEEGNDVFTVFEENFAKVLIKLEFPNASENIQDRLSRAMAFRRRRFSYQRQHARKLSDQTFLTKRRHPISRIQDGPVHMSTARMNEQGLQGVSPTSSSFSPPMRQAAMSLLSETTASRFTESRFRPDAPSTKASSILTPTGTQKRRLNVPPPPKIPSGAIEFHCPHCNVVVPVSEAKGKRWKSHIIQDLEPYVCLVDSCPEGSRSFRDRSSWFTHMRTHAKEWVCALPGHQELTFRVEAEYDNHIQLIHQGHFKDLQLEMIKLRSERQGPVPFRNCPLCMWRPNVSDVSNIDDQLEYSDLEPETQAVLLQQLREHCADHLQFIAMYCLMADAVEDDYTSMGDPSLTQLDVDNTALSEIAPRVSESDFDIELPSGIETSCQPSDSIEQMGITEMPTEASMTCWADWAYVLRDVPYPPLDEDEKMCTFIRNQKMRELLAEGATLEPKLPCHIIPNVRNPRFFGREEAMESLQRKLLPRRDTSIALNQDQAVRTAILQGAGGVGKTQIALEFAYRQRHILDAIFWVRADEPLKLANDVNRIALELGLVEKGTPESRDHLLARDLFRTWLANSSQLADSEGSSSAPRWLFIFDHVIWPEVLSEYWPMNGSNGAILITTRRTMPWNIVRYPVIRVEPFSSEEGAAFLGSLTSQKSKESLDCGAVVSQRVSGFPHELTLLARIIQNRGSTIPEFLRLYDDRQSQSAILTLNVQDLQSSRDEFFSGWALDVLDDQAAALLNILSMLDPDGIPEEILTASPSFMPIAYYPSQILEYKAARAMLLSHGLVSRDEGKGRLVLHRLIQDAARRRMSKDYTIAAFNSCVALINAVWPYQEFTWRHSIARWPLCENLFLHIIRIEKWAEQIETSISDIAGAFQYARLTTDAGWFCHETGRFLESEKFLRIAQRICDKLKTFYPLSYHVETDDTPSIEEVDAILAEVHHNRGCIAAETNRPAEALAHQLIFNEMMTRIKRESQPGTDMRLPISWSQLGVAYMVNEDWEKGEECFLKSIRLMKQLKDYEAFKISLPLINLGLAWWLRGRFEDAVICLQEALQAREKQFGPNDRESFITGRIRHAMGNVKASQGLLEESFRHHELARNHYKETLGRGHHRFADTCVKVADHYFRKGELDMALELVGQAVKVYQDRNTYYPEKCRALYMRTKINHKLNRPVDAKIDEEEALRLYRMYQPADKRDLADLKDEDFDAIIVFWSR